MRFVLTANVGNMIDDVVGLDVDFPRTLSIRTV